MNAVVLRADDSYHSIYAGLNYYLCGNNSKVQVGAEYETLDTDRR